MGPCLNFLLPSAKDAEASCVTSTLSSPSKSPRTDTIHISMRDVFVCVSLKSPFVLSENHGAIQPQGRLQQIGGAQDLLHTTPFKNTALG